MSEQQRSNTYLNNSRGKPGPPTGLPSNNPAGRNLKGTEKRSKSIAARITPTAYAWLTRDTDNVADAIEALARTQPAKAEGETK